MWQEQEIRTLTDVIACSCKGQAKQGKGKESNDERVEDHDEVKVDQVRSYQSNAGANVSSAERPSGPYRTRFGYRSWTA